MNKLLCIVLTMTILFTVGCTNLKSPDDTSGEQITDPDPLQSISSAESGSYTPTWFLSETLENGYTPPVQLSKYAVKFAPTYEITSGDLLFRFDFFQEYYPIGSTIQVRITVTNNAPEYADEKTYHANSPLLGIFESETAGTSGFIPVLDPDCGEDFSFFTDNVVQNAFPTSTTLTFERAYYVSDDYFSIGQEYTYSFIFAEKKPTYKVHEIKIPLEIVEVELTAEG